MSTSEQDRMKRLLQQALPPVGATPEPPRDLWPAVLNRLRARQPGPIPAWAWFDAALLAGLVAVGAAFPGVIPVILYYL